MNKTDKLTEIVFILDESGSMYPLRADTIGGFNSVIEQQKEETEGRVIVSAIFFSTQAREQFAHVAIDEVRPLQARDYRPNGGTALYDALGQAIVQTDTTHQYIPKAYRPDHTMFVIITDGMENASRKWNAAGIHKLIDAKKNEGWEFLFIGANIDAVSTAADLGIDADRAVDYLADTAGTEVVYDAVCAAVSSVRMEAPLQPNWSASIRSDRIARSPKPNDLHGSPASGPKTEKLPSHKQNGRKTHH